MSNLEELELKILRSAVDLAKSAKKRAVKGPEIEKIISIVEEFLEIKS